MLYIASTKTKQKPLNSKHSQRDRAQGNKEKDKQEESTRQLEKTSET
jgi:hypothetical protein